MKKFTIEKNSYLDRDVKAYYNCDYVGYQQKGNPDFINRLKNMSKTHSEMDLVKDYIEVSERATKDLKTIITNENLVDCVICVIPRSKAEKRYPQKQLMFKKAISSIADSLELINGTDAIKRVKDTKTTHDWRLQDNTGEMPYKGITKDTCEFNQSKIRNKNIILVDDIYTDGVNIAEDCLQTLFDFGAKSVIMYAVARTTKS